MESLHRSAQRFELFGLFCQFQTGECLFSFITGLHTSGSASSRACAASSAHVGALVVYPLAHCQHILVFLGHIANGKSHIDDISETPLKFT